MTLKIYDGTIDRMRDATQEDIDVLAVRGHQYAILRSIIRLLGEIDVSKTTLEELGALHDHIDRTFKRHQRAA